MKCKLVKAVQVEGILASDMEPGEIGTITAWGETDYIGEVVKRCGRCLFSITSDEHWIDFFNGHAQEGCCVELLKSGDSIVITGSTET